MEIVLLCEAWVVRTFSKSTLESTYHSDYASQDKIATTQGSSILSTMRPSNPGGNVDRLFFLMESDAHSRY